MSESLVTQILGARDLLFHPIPIAVARHRTRPFFPCCVRRTGEIIFELGIPCVTVQYPMCRPVIGDPALTQLQVDEDAMFKSNV